MFKNVALALIRGYQRYLSPRKGFSCAYRVHAGGHSCSAFGHRAISRRGLLLGLVLLRRRLARCSWEHHQHQLRWNAYRSGFVDGADCSGCDVGACDMPSFHGLGSDIGGCGCDIGAELAGACLPGDCGEGPCDGGTGWSREEARRKRMAERRAQSDVAVGSEPGDDSANV